jgi:YbgC/YbaW family acyl-CoA thioester hydrolase
MTEEARRAASPAPSRPPEAETEVVVRSSELDSFGHVNHAVFLSYLEHARFEALEAAGFSWSVLEEREWGVYVVRIEVDYLAEARRGDRLLVRTSAESFRRTSMVLVQEIVRRSRPGPDSVGPGAASGGEERIVQARVTAVWIGPDKRPMRVPDEVRSGLSGEGSNGSAPDAAATPRAGVVGPEDPPHGKAQ